jgi:hypothetical protein
MIKIALILIALLVTGCATQPVNPFSLFAPSEVQRIEICYRHDLIPDEFGCEPSGPFSDDDVYIPTCKSYRIPISETNLIAKLHGAVNSVPLSVIESEPRWESSLCEQVFIGHDGHVLAIVSAYSRPTTIQVMEGYRRAGTVIRGRKRSQYSFRGVATNSQYHSLLDEHLVEQVQTEWFMDLNNPGLRLRKSVLKKETEQQSTGE